MAGLCWHRPGTGYGCTVLEFAFPAALALLPLPALVFWLAPPHRERVSAIRVPFFDLLVTAAGGNAQAGAVILRRRLLQWAFALLVWVGLIAGLARPEWVADPVVRTEAARDIMLAIDLSGSMDYRDFPAEDGSTVRRFQAVQAVVERFVAERESDRIGMVVFGTRAYLQLPFTRDLQTAAQLVRLMEVGMAGPRTALGDAIGLAIRAFESSEVDERILILLTDGNDTASTMTPVNAAGIARLQGVEIYTIGIGDTQARGEDRVDFEALAAIASSTGGQFYNAEDEATLGEVYRRIDAATSAEVRTQSWRPRRSLVQWPAGLVTLAILAACAVMLLTERGRRGAGAP
jgi:Ca-activated chloride channel family protein